MISQIIARYLDKNEAVSLKNNLEKAGIESVVKLHGLPKFLGGMTNYQVQVDPADIEKATEVFEKFKETTANARKEEMIRLTTQCPRCGSKEIFEKEKKSLFRKIYYFRVKLWGCKECNFEWFT